MPVGFKSRASSAREPAAGRGIAMERLEVVATDVSDGDGGRA